MKQAFIPSSTVLFFPLYVLTVNSISGGGKYLLFVLFLGLFLLNLFTNFHYLKKIKFMQRDLFYYLAFLTLISISLLREIFFGVNLAFSISLLLTLWISFFSFYCSFQYFLSNNVSYDNILRTSFYLPVVINVALYFMGFQQESMSSASFSGLDFRVSFSLSYGINAFGIYCTVALIFAFFSLVFNQGNRLFNFCALFFSLFAFLLTEARGSGAAALFVIFIILIFRIMRMPNAFRLLIICSPFFGFALFFIPEIVGYFIPFQRDIDDITTLNNRIYYYEILFEELGTLSFDTIFGHNFYFQPEEFTNFLYLSKVGIENPLYTTQHNTILQLFSQVGLFGLSIFMYFIFKISKTLFLLLVSKSSIMVSSAATFLACLFLGNIETVFSPINPFYLILHMLIISSTIEASKIKEQQN